MFWSVTQVYRRDKSHITLIRYRILSKRGNKRKEETKREGGLGREEGRKGGRKGKRKRKRGRKGQRTGGRKVGANVHFCQILWVVCSSVKSEQLWVPGGGRTAMLSSTIGPGAPAEGRGDSAIQMAGSGGKDVSRAQRWRRHRAQTRRCGRWKVCPEARAVGCGLCRRTWPETDPKSLSPWGLCHYKSPLEAPGGSLVNNLPAMQKTWVRSLGQEDPLEKGMATHSSILAWESPWTEEPDGLQSMGTQRVRHDLKMEHKHKQAHTIGFCEGTLESVGWTFKNENKASWQRQLCWSNRDFRKECLRGIQTTWSRN